MVMGYPFCLSTVFTLAMTLRDAQGAPVADARREGDSMRSAAAAE